MLATVVALTGGMLAGCVPAEPRASPTATATGTVPLPAFTTDDAAFTAAVEAYQEYLAAYIELDASGSTDLSPLSSYLTPEYLIEEEASRQETATKGWRPVGIATADSFSLKHKYMGSDGRTTVIIYLCFDVSGVRLIDQGGNDVTPDRPERVPLEITFVAEGNDPNRLLVDGSQVWHRQDAC